jgi:hypothetical protein
MATLLAHIYNEEQLLPLWLEHHSKYFEEGIIVDFASTDRSRDILAEYPQFKVYDSKIEYFGVIELDAMMTEFERPVIGKRMVLNLSEFLIGDPERAERDLFIPSVSLINMPFDKEFDWSQQFYEQRKYGISYEQDFGMRRSRILANSLPSYPIGRHYDTIDNDGFIIIHVASCLVNEAMYKRRLQIQNKIPQKDIDRGYGFHHMITHDSLISIEEDLRQKASDVSSYIDAALNI